MGLPERETDDARVIYPVRVLLDRIDKRLESIEGRLDDRVTSQVFQGLGQDMQALRRELVGRVEALEDAEAARLARSTGAYALLRQVGAVGGWVMAAALGIVSILDKVGVL